MIDVCWWRRFLKAMAIGLSGAGSLAGLLYIGNHIGGPLGVMCAVALWGVTIVSIAYASDP